MNYHRHSIRLNNFDYSNDGYYFVTIGAYKHAHFWGEIKNSKFQSNQIGKIINNYLNLLPNKFDIQINDYQIMPNHLHVILKINRRGLIYQTPNNKIDIAKTCKHMGLINQTPTLGQMVRFFKAKCTYEINKQNIFIPLLCEGHIFQRNYYEHIIRNEKEYLRIKEYIELNPQKWGRDRNNI